MIKRMIRSFDLLKALQEFPLSSVMAIWASSCIILFIDFNDSQFLLRMAGSAYLAFLAAISAEIFIRQSGRKWVYILPLMLLVGWFLYLPEDFENIPRYLENRYVFRSLGLALLLHLVISFIPYIKPSSEVDFWEYNKHLFLRIFESGLFSLILFLGLAMAILAVDKLFGIDVDGEWYGRLFVFLAGVFNSLYFLSKFPKIDYDRKTHKPEQSYKVFSEYILIGISVIYTILLYAYAAKIMIKGELPQGWIGYLTLCFSVVGILTWLLNYFNPRFSDSKFTKFYIDHLFKFFTLPVIMLFVAIVVRLQEYGVTENRYVVATLAVWLGLLTIGYGWLKKLHIKYIPISLAVLTMFSIFSGPLDMFNASLRNQTKRLSDFLVENEILKERKFDWDAVGEIDNTHKAQLKDAIIGLEQRSDLELINDWVDEDIFQNFDQEKNSNKAIYINRKFGILNVPSIRSHNYRSFTVNLKEDEVIVLDGYDQMKLVKFSESGISKRLHLVNDNALFLDGFDTISLNINIPAYQDHGNEELSSDELSFTFRNASDSCKIIIRSLFYSIDKDKVKLKSWEGFLLENEVD